MLEEKQTIKAMVPLREWYGKVTQEAVRRGKHPAIVLSLESLTHTRDVKVAVIPYLLFLDLLGRDK